MQLPLVAKVLREASALMRISSYIIYPSQSLVRNHDSFMSLALGARQLKLNNKYFNAVNGHIRVSTLVIMNLLI